ncbi:MULTISPECIES: ATP-binding protein [Ramlibacter]|uniref:histidine kinase n=1 Tax=Ramlibacter aquaticus TaxID=2780094 RepID=A0ABR9SDC7_9BURK|nr:MULTISPECIES: ATP-binding protein [Ramlibacter]MBE7940363.1 response regulator [Ramlibacter aquaticus]
MGERAEPQALESTRLRRVQALDLADRQPEPVLDGLVELMGEMAGAQYAMLTLVGEDHIWVQSALGLPAGRKFPREGNFCAFTILADAVFEVEDAAQDPRFRESACVREAPHIAHYVGAPLCMPDGERVGALCLLWDRPGRLPPAQAALLERMAARLVQVLLLRQREHEAVALAEGRTQLLQDVIQHMPAGLAVFDPQLRHELSNPLVRDYMGLPDHLLEAPDASYGTLAAHLASRGFYGPGRPEELTAERLRGATDPTRARYDRRLPDGRIVERHGAVMPDGRLVITYTDVTVARQATAELARSRGMLALALDAARMGVWEMDLATREVQASPGWPEALGLPDWRSLGDALSATRLADGRAPGRLAVPLLKGEVDRISVEHALPLADGRTVWLLTQYRVAERDASGRATRLVGTSCNIDERMQARVAREAALQAAESANRAKSEFLATMSHEIRTPIHGVIGISRMLADSPLDAQQRAWLGVLDSCAAALLGLVDDVLDVSRIEAGRLELREERVALHALLEDVAAVVGIKARERGLALEFSLSAGLPDAVRGDGQRLRQVLTNLLGNAVKFTPSGRITLQAGVVAGERLRIAVRDTGIGISPADQARLFKRFTQVEAGSTRRHGGTGLGLAISRELARLMGGDITVESEPGQGATFTLDLPLRADAPEAALAMAAGAGAAGTARGRILVVEDNAVNRMVVEGLLARAGHAQVTLAEDGAQAVTACREAAFDLVLMDCQMPVMDGYEAARELRSAGLAMPIVALTANASVEDRARCLAAGMDDYLAKPIDGQMLAERVAHWLEQAAQR